MKYKIILCVIPSRNSWRWICNILWRPKQNFNFKLPSIVFIVRTGLYQNTQLSLTYMNSSLASSANQNILGGGVQWHAMSKVKPCDLWTVHVWRLGCRSTRKHVAPSRFFTQTSVWVCLTSITCIIITFMINVWRVFVIMHFFVLLWRVVALNKPSIQPFKSWICGFVCVSFHIFQLFYWHTFCTQQKSVRADKHYTFIPQGGSIYLQ